MGLKDGKKLVLACRHAKNAKKKYFLHLVFACQHAKNKQTLLFSVCVLKQALLSIGRCGDSVRLLCLWNGSWQPPSGSPKQSGEPASVCDVILAGMFLLNNNSLVATQSAEEWCFRIPIRSWCWNSQGLDSACTAGRNCSLAGTSDYNYWALHCIIVGILQSGCKRVFYDPFQMSVTFAQ